MVSLMLVVHIYVFVPFNSGLLRSILDQFLILLLWFEFRIHEVYILLEQMKFV